MGTTGTMLSSTEPTVTVTIQVDANLEVQSVAPDQFVISKSKNQQVLWRASDPRAQFNIDFKQESPFQYTQFSNVEPYSGLVRREVLGDLGKYYKYTVRTGKKSIDPGGVVSP
jgi:hypothetical protein